ncbi:uncharacterized protein HD556DRAFT_1314544 [Suillus plorans]|uniref:Uncharacterized protein n=1 Tax=Suillus plorans TaxID=116603 RepID=A0A9P7A9R3_9AGAM|nr:uncharacterized protein HD556DRAFT_1314544 [Suillus plorans]KAG1785104.1 hypothetical protein HD556DRAFT_1314544 [Suillus plorans]
MPKRKVGHLSNLHGHAKINTKRTRVRKSQKEEKENVVDVFLDAAKVIAQPEYASCKDDCEGSLDEDGDIFEAEALEDGIESKQGVGVDVTPGTYPEGPQCTGRYCISSAGLAWELQKAPKVLECATALQDLRDVLKPCQDTRRGYKDPGLDNWTKGRLESMVTLLVYYTNPSSPGYKAWMAALLLTANGKEMLSWWACDLCEATKAYINNCINIPINLYEDVMEYLDRDEVKMRLKLKKTISLSTAKRWMNSWTIVGSGITVVNMLMVTRNGLQRKGKCVPGEQILRKSVVLSDPYVSGSMTKSRWIHKNTSAIPYAKVEGASLMVADFVSADHSWLQSPDGKESAWVLFKAGKSRDGYFSNEEILTQCQKAMDIVQASWPDEDHMFVFDNVTTHLKRPYGSLSAWKMSKGIPKVGMNWGVKVMARNSVGKIIYGADGKPSKTKICMANGTFKDSSAQSFYFLEGHARGGVFKGMATILEEHGYSDMSNIQAECKPNFTCKPGIPCCCC